MAKALGDGHFPVRWTQNFGYGYGMPLFEFYGPLPFYIGAVLFWLGLSAVGSIKILYLIANAGTAWGGYLLGKRFYGRSGGLITAAALTLAPYRALNLFVRGALNETWAIMFFPWILLGVVQIFHREKRGWLLLTLSLTGLFLSHNIMTLLFLPVLVLFILGDLGQLIYRRVPELYRRTQFRWRNFSRMVGELIGGGLLAVGLSAFYLFPAYLEKNLTQVESVILSPYFDYRLHFLYIRQFFNPRWGFGGSGWSITDDISFFLGWGQWLAIGLFVILFLSKLWRRLRSKQLTLFSKREWSLLSLTGGLLIMTLYLSILKSQWAWDLLPIFKFVQFPWRWLGISVVFLALGLGGITWLVKKRLIRGYLSMVVVVLTVLGAVWYFRPEKYLADSNQFYYTDPSLIRRELSGILHDYVPVGVPIPPSVIPEELVINEVPTANGSFEVLADRTQEKLIRTNFTADTLLSLAVADYPGWRVEIDNQRWSRQLGENGNIELLVPAGKHVVTLRFLSTPIRQFADWASLAAGILLVFLLLPKNLPALSKEQKRKASQ
ncbi:MAG: hypothetical protein UY13_C0002G0277 [Candidatus Pacebacteria bacterium GW2011_GWB1_47_8]|nr:MAG: hypothetical protein UX28_C0001G0425 [Candidatus Pacebacteria bacterium GW2011_GWA1_46_10]KKU84365.1 MAG: hypothetical protein UY13_C0002G0277 [Candidatus Pacebacteria bacterium GW2011_GWB1_47_8]